MNDNHVLRLTGKAELPEAIQQGHNYHVSIEGSIDAVTQSDNHDGTYTYSYRFKPVKVDLLNAQGQTIRAKDTRGKSQLLRARLWKVWTNNDDGLEFNDWYDRLMNNLVIHAEEIADMYHK